MKKGFKEKVSPFQTLENHFLNVYHAGVYLSAQEMVNVGKTFGYDIPLKSRELIIKNLLNTANDKDELASVIANLSTIIQERIQTLNTLATDFPKAATFLKGIIQRTTSTDLLLKRQLQANPYE